jgi:hypothetical protein
MCFVVMVTTCKFVALYPVVLQSDDDDDDWSESESSSSDSGDDMKYESGKLTADFFRKKYVCYLVCNISIL